MGTKMMNRIELHDFPLDVQELSITFASRYRPSKVRLIADCEKISYIHPDALHTFRDQQKWNVSIYKDIRRVKFETNDVSY